MLHRILVATSALLSAGCATGMIFTHTVEPLDTQFDYTPVFRDKLEAGEGDVKHISLHRFPVYIDIMWDSNAIGDIAHREGIEDVYYADLERLSILGIWNQDTVHIYGKPAAH